MPPALAAPDASGQVAARIDAMAFSHFHMRLLAALGSAHLFDAYDATALAFVLPVLVTQWSLTPGQVGLLLSAGYAGQFAGALLAGKLAERFGRNPVLRGSLAVLALFSLAIAFAPRYGVLLLLRVVQGVGLGGETPVAAAYLGELSPARLRGRMVSTIQWMFAIGTMVSAGLAPLLVPRFGWPSLFIVGAAPLLLAALLRRLLPESPRWLAAHGRAEAARRALARIGAEAGELAPATLVAHEIQPWSALFAAGRARATLAAWLIAFCASLVGYGIIGWMPTLYRIVYHLPVHTALRYGISTGIAALAGGLLCIVVIDRLSRKAYLVLGFSGCALWLAMLAALGGGATPLQAAILSGLAFAMLGMPLSGLYVYVPELYPVQLKALGMGAASAWLRVASIVGPPVIGAMIGAWPVQRVFLLFAAVSAVGALGTACLAKETRPRVAGGFTGAARAAAATSWS